MTGFIGPLGLLGFWIEFVDTATSLVRSICDRKLFSSVRRENFGL